MFDVTKLRGVVAVAVNVVVAVAGALNAPDIADQLKALGLTADEAINAAVALVTAATVLIGALSNKVEPKDKAAVKAVNAAVHADPVNAPEVVKEAVAEAKAEVSASV